MLADLVQDAIGPGGPCRAPPLARADGLGGHPAGRRRWWYHGTLRRAPRGGDRAGARPAARPHADRGARAAGRHASPASESTASWWRPDPTRSSRRSRGRWRSAGGWASRTGWCGPTTAFARSSCGIAGACIRCPTASSSSRHRAAAVRRLVALLGARQAPHGARSRVAARQRRRREPGRIRAPPAGRRGAGARGPAAGGRDLHGRPRRPEPERDHAPLHRGGAHGAVAHPGPASRGCGRRRCRGPAARAGRSSSRSPAAWKRW